MTEPYGPCTPLVRAFLVRFAGLGADAKRRVVAHHETVIQRPDYQAAEITLGDTIARTGRIDLRDALAGPLLQLVRRSDETSAIDASPADPLADLEPIAEPALAALITILVADVLPPAVRTVLYAPFAELIPLSFEPLAKHSRD